MDLADKIRQIERLIAQTTSAGERRAAELARERLQEKQANEGKKGVCTCNPEFSVRLADAWKKKLFLALCYKHKLRPYRYSRQKHTTVMVRVSRSFMDSVLWPEFMQYQTVLEQLIGEITQDLISKIHHVKQEEVVINGALDTSCCTL